MVVVFFFIFLFFICLHYLCHWQDLDGYLEDDVDGDLGAHDGEHYFSSAPSGWDDPVNHDVPPPYVRTDSGPQDYNGGSYIGRGESFVSSAMIV